MADIEVDISQLESLGADFARASLLGMRRVVLKGEALVVEKVPTATGNLRQGVGSVFDAGQPGGTVYITAKRGAQGARQATLHGANGKTKSITLRGTAEFNYARVVAEGRKAQLAPKSARAFLIPVSSAPGTGSYITAGGQTFIVRRSLRAVPANPFDLRAQADLVKVIEPIFAAALDKVLGE